MWRTPVILARLWIDNVNIFLRGVGWQQGDFKAFAEFMAAHEQLGYDYIDYIRNGGQVAVRLRRPGA